MKLNATYVGLSALIQTERIIAARITPMIDKYRLDDLRLESGEKGELARWVIQLQKDLDYERRKVPVPPAMAAKGSEPVADVVAWYKEGEERTCDIRWRRFDVAPGPLFAVAQTVAVDNTFIPKNLDRALGVVGVALPESKEEFNFQIERWIQRLIDRVIRYADEFKEQPEPVLPDEIAAVLITAIEKEQDRLFGEDYLMDSKDCVDVIREEVERINACRAAMLNHSENERDMVERVSQHYKLREQVRREHAEWSDATFGDVGPIGPLKHLSKEALEAAAEPDDLSEWADMQFLLWDAQRRAGISDGEITAAMEEKLKVNMARQWPEPKDGEPRMHIKDAGNSPVIPDGWQLVPVEPTLEMIKSGANAASTGMLIPGMYRAMLAVAPQQEGK